MESPTFYAMLHAIERMGMRALEVATHPVDGIDLDALERVLERERIAACMVMPNFQNPLGFQMPDSRKRALVELLAKHGVPAIESDVYHELHFGDTTPSALKSFDRDEPCCIARRSRRACRRATGSAGRCRAATAIRSRS